MTKCVGVSGRAGGCEIASFGLCSKDMEGEYDGYDDIGKRDRAGSRSGF